MQGPSAAGRRCGGLVVPSVPGSWGFSLIGVTPGCISRQFAMLACWARIFSKTLCSWTASAMPGGRRRRGLTGMVGLRTALPACYRTMNRDTSAWTARVAPWWLIMTSPISMVPVTVPPLRPHRSPARLFAMSGFRDQGGPLRSELYFLKWVWGYQALNRPAGRSICVFIFDLRRGENRVTALPIRR